MPAEANHSVVLGQVVTPETVRGVIPKAAAINGGTHVLRWRDVAVTYEGITSQRDVLVPTALSS